MDRYGAVVLAGGAGRRLGGAAKPTLAVAGRAMLARVLAAVSDAEELVVVGPASLRALVPETVTLVQEEPAGGGPVAGLAAGLAALGAAAAHGALGAAAGQGALGAAAGQGPLGAAAGQGALGAAEGQGPLGAAAGQGALGAAEAEGALGAARVLVLAADLPLLTREAVRTLLAAVGDGQHDGAVFVDGDGRQQWLCGAWSAAALGRRLAAMAAGGPLAGRAMRELVAPLRVVGVPVDGGGRPPWYDCDTPADLADAERRLT